MARYWQLLVKARGDTKPATKAMRDLKRSSRNLQKAIGVDFGNIARMSAFALGAGLAASVKVGVDEMREAKVVSAQLTTALRNNGKNAGVTRAEIDKLADSLSYKAAIDDELVASAAAQTLAFRNVRNEAGKGNDIFTRLATVSVDFAATGKDLVTSQKKFALALNDPTKASRVLRSVGISLTKAQQDQIKTMTESGDTLGAQRFILAELEKRYAGVAAQVGNQRPFERLQNTFRNLMATLVSGTGAGFGPFLNQLSASIRRMDEFFKSARGQAVLADLNTKLRGLASAIGAGIRQVVAIIQKLYQWRAVLKPVAVGILSIVAAAKAYRIAVAAAQVAQDAFRVALVAAKGVVQAYKAAVLALKGAKVALTAATTATKAALSGIKWLVLKAGVVAYKVALAAAKGATVALRVATIAATVAVRALSLAMAMNPVGVIVLAVVALVAALVVAYKRSEKFRAIVNAVIEAFKRLGKFAVQVFQSLRARMQPVINIIRTIGTVYIKGVILYFRLLATVAGVVWNSIRAAWGRAVGLFNRVKNALNFSSAFSSLKEGFRDALNGIIRLWNNLEFGIPGLPGRFKKYFDGVKISTPNIPYLAEGGTIRRPGTVLVGEAGPEYLTLPRGARVTPLDKAGGNTYNVTVNASQPVDTVAFMRSLRTAARMGTV